MNKKLDLPTDTMALSLVLWLCSLPLIALLVLPFFGPGAALSTALALLVIFLALCWGVCLRDLARHSRDR